MLVVEERTTKQQVRAQLDEAGLQFVDDCLSAGFDVIVAVESEGVAVLLPRVLARPHNGVPLIIPDSVIQKLPHLVAGKRVLVFDASAMHGQKLAQTAELVRHIAKSTERAVMLLHEDCPVELRPDRFGLELDDRSYVWAKTRLTEIILARPFPLDGDHLIFALEYDSEEFTDSIIDAIYAVGETSEISPPGSSIIRLTVDGIRPNPRWPGFPEGMWFESVCKIRVYLDPAHKQFSVIPIIFPAIPTNMSEGATGCTFCELCSELKVPVVPHEGGETSERCFRCASLYCSVILMEEFTRRFLKYLDRSTDRGLHTVGLSIPDSMPDVSRGFWPLAFEHPGEVIATAYSRVRSLLDQSGLQQMQLDLASGGEESMPFVFPCDRGPGEAHDSSATVRPPGFPWQSVLTEVGRWYATIIEAKGSKNPSQLDSMGIAFSELVGRLASRVSKSLVSASLDVLLDEGMLRPRTVRIAPPGQGCEYWARGYTTGGEYIRIMALGLAAMADGNWRAIHKRAVNRTKRKEEDA